MWIYWNTKRRLYFKDVINEPEIANISLIMAPTHDDVVNDPQGGGFSSFNTQVTLIKAHYAAYDRLKRLNLTYHI